MTPANIAEIVSSLIIAKTVNYSRRPEGRNLKYADKQFLEDLICVLKEIHKEGTIPHFALQEYVAHKRRFSRKTGDPHHYSPRYVEHLTELAIVTTTATGLLPARTHSQQFAEMIEELENKV